MTIIAIKIFIKFCQRYKNGVTFILPQFFPQ